MQKLGIAALEVVKSPSTFKMLFDPAISLSGKRIYLPILKLAVQVCSLAHY